MGKSSKVCAFCSISTVYWRNDFCGKSRLYNFFTLGSVPMVDHSLFLLVQRYFTDGFTVIFILFWLINLRDAKIVAEKEKCW